jgi:hypothetical protein
LAILFTLRQIANAVIILNYLHLGAAMHGVVLTDASDLAALMAAFHRAELGALKIVTGWGSDWKRAELRALAATAPALIVRSEVGDGIKPPDPNKLREEIKPW